MPGVTYLTAQDVKPLVNKMEGNAYFTELVEDLCLQVVSRMLSTQNTT